MSPTTVTEPQPIPLRRGIRDLGPIAAALAVVLLVFAPLVRRPNGVLADPVRPRADEHVAVDERVPGNDLTRLFWPNGLRIARAVQQTGHLPAWDPAGFGGRPLVGNPQMGLWYPPNRLVWMAGGHPAAIAWLTVAHLGLAAAGAVVLARLQGLGRLAAFVAGVAYAVGPYLMGHVDEGHHPHVWGMALAPWGFAAWVAWRQRRAWGLPLLPAVLALALLTGHAQEGFYLLVTLSVATAALAIRRSRPERRQALRGWIGWIAVVAIALLLTAPEWLPAAALRNWLHRGTELSVREASRYHVGPLSLLQWLNPGALGGPTDYFGRDNYWEPQLGLGWTVLVLAIIGARSQISSRFVRGWLALAVVAFLFAAGRRLGVFALFYYAVPGIDHFRVPARSLFLVSLAVSQLAAYGVAALANGPSAEWRLALRRYASAALPIGLVVALLAAFVPVGADVTPGSTAGLPAAAHRLATNPVFGLALLGTGLALALGARHRRLGVAALALLAVGEVAMEAGGLVTVAPVSAFVRPDPVARLILDQTAPGQPPRIRARSAAYPDLPTVVAGIDRSDLNDYVQFQHAADLYERLYPLFDGPERKRTMRSLFPESPELRRAVLDRMAIQWVVTDRPLDPGDAEGLRLHQEGPALVYENSSALPRAYVVPRAEVEADRPLLVGRFAEVPARDAVFLAADPLADQPADRRQPFTPATYERPAPDRVTVRVPTEAPGLLVVADTWMPGWSARLDGKAVPVLRGNHAQRVVALPAAGDHRVEMTYTPPGLALALGFSGIGFVLLAGLAAGSVVATRRRKTKSTAFVGPHAEHQYTSTRSRLVS
jgi:hypothetical protein